MNTSLSVTTESRDIWTDDGGDWRVSGVVWWLL